MSKVLKYKPEFDKTELHSIEKAFKLFADRNGIMNLGIGGTAAVYRRQIPSAQAFAHSDRHKSGGFSYEVRTHLFGRKQ